MASGQYYEAQEMLRATLIRLSRRKKFSDAQAMATDAAVTFLQQKQESCAVEVATALVKLHQDAWKAKGKVRAKAPYMSADFTAVASAWPNCDSKIDFLRSALRFSSSVCAPGHHQLHRLLAAIFRQGKAYGPAAVYFAAAQNPNDYAGMVVEWFDSGGRSDELDLFITREILRSLSVGPIGCPLTCAQSFLRHFETMGRDPSKTPLMNFIRMMLELLAEPGVKKKRGLLVLLVKTYKPVLSRDPGFDKYLKTVDERWFATTP